MLTKRMKFEQYCLVWNNKTIRPGGRGPPECHLRAALYSNEVFRFANDSNVYVCIDYLDLFYIILKFLHCSINFVVSSDDFDGQKINGTWTGVLRLFAEKKVDIAAHSFAVYGERAELLYFDLLKPDKQLLGMLSYPRQSRSHTPWQHFVSRFSPSVWYLQELAFLIFGFILAFVWRIKSKRMDDFSWIGRSVRNYVDLLGISLGQPNRQLSAQPRTILTTIVFMFILMIFFFRQLFLGDSTALMLTSEPHRIDRFEQIAIENLRPVVSESSAMEIFSNLYPSLATRSLMITRDNMTATATVKSFINGQAVLVGTVPTLEEITLLYPYIPFHISTETHGQALSNYAIRRGLDSIVQRRLAKLFRYIHYFGLHQKPKNKFVIDKLIRLQTFKAQLELNWNLTQSFAYVLHDYGPNRQRNFEKILKKENGGEKTSINLMLILYFYAYGLLIAFSCFIEEIVWFYLQIYFKT